MTLLSLLPGISSYRAVVGGQILLPCNTTRWVEEDISLVIWYRGNTGIPIYTVDARSSRLSHSKQVPSEELGGRAVMDVSVLPPTLKLDPVIEEDEGDYRCRVDYRKHRTQHFLVHLNVTGNTIYMPLPIEPVVCFVSSIHRFD